MVLLVFIAESQTTSAFGSTGIGKSGFGGQRGGSRVANYESTAEADGGTSGQTTKLESISAFGSTGIGKLGFGVQGVGSRVANYEPTAEADGGTSRQTVILGSISAMPIYKDKSHEELGWEDYQIGDKGVPISSAQSTGLVGFNSTTTQTNTFAPAPAFGQPAPNPFSTPTPLSPFATKSSPLSNGFGTSSTIVGTSTSAATPIFGSSTSTFVANSPSPVFSSSPAVGTSLPLGSSINFGNTQSSNLFSCAPAPPTIAQSGPAFGQSTTLFGQNTSAFSQSSLFNSPSSGLGGNIFSSSASLTSSNLAGFGQTAPSLSTPLLTGQAAQTGGNFAFSNFGQTQPVGASSYSGTPGIYGQSNFGLPIMIRVRVVPRFQALHFFFFWFMLLLLFFVFFLVFRDHLALLFEHTM